MNSFFVFVFDGSISEISTKYILTSNMLLLDKIKLCFLRSSSLLSMFFVYTFFRQSIDFCALSLLVVIHINGLYIMELLDLVC